MKIGICDDLPEERNLLIQYCHHLGYQDTYVYSSGEDLLNSPELTTLTLVFLDIELKERNGITVKKQMERLSPTTLIVFCTTHQELMPDAFGRNVIFFLTKPLTEHAVEQSLKQAAYITKDFYPIIADQGIALACRDVIYLQAEQKYTVIYTEDGTTHLSRKALREWKEELSELGFCAISRSAIINLKYYKKLTEKNRKVLMQNGASIPISRHYQNVLRKQMDAFMLHQIRLE